MLKAQEKMNVESQWGERKQESNGNECAEMELRAHHTGLGSELEVWMEKGQRTKPDKLSGGLHGKPHTFRNQK